MTKCNFEQFKATSTPPLKRTQVMFCACAYCTRARDMQALGLDVPMLKAPTRERLEALRWKPEEPEEAP